MASCSLLFTPSHCPAPLRSPYPNMNALHDRKGDCYCRPRSRPHKQHSLHAMNATISWRMSAKTRQGQKKSPTCSLYRLWGGGLDFLVNNQVHRREGFATLRPSLFGRPCGDGGGGVGAAGGAFVLLSRLPSHCLFLRCAEPMDGCRHWLLSPSLPSLLYPPRGPRGVPRRHRKAFLKSRYDFLTCFVANYFKFVCFAITRTKYTLFKSYRE